MKAINSIIENHPKIPDNAPINKLPKTNHNQIVNPHLTCPLTNCPRAGIKKLSIAGRTCLFDGDTDISE